MSLTDLETIKKIIQSNIINIPTIYNERVLMTLFEAGQLSHNNIDLNSESVKIIRQSSPSADSNNPITLTDQVNFQLNSQKIVWDSVVVSSDLALSTVYIENDDYIIDYFNGTVERTSIGSNIPNGGSVYIWYLPFTVLNEGNDYNIDYDYGIIKRRAGTTIPNKATVYVDYSHSQATTTDAAIVEFISEMEAFIEPRLKGGYTLDSDNIGLKSASSNFVMYLVCLSESFKNLHNPLNDNSDDIARRYNDLADKYLSTAYTMFSKYLNVTTQSIGGLIQNRYSSSRNKVVSSPSISPNTRRH